MELLLCAGHGLDTGVPGICLYTTCTPSNPSSENLPRGTRSWLPPHPSPQLEVLRTRLGTEAGDAGLADANPPFLASRGWGLGCGVKE